MKLIVIVILENVYVKNKQQSTPSTSNYHELLWLRRTERNRLKSKKSQMTSQNVLEDEHETHSTIKIQMVFMVYRIYQLKFK